MHSVASNRKPATSSLNRDLQNRVQAILPEGSHVSQNTYFKILEDMLAIINANNANIHSLLTAGPLQSALHVTAFQAHNKPVRWNGDVF